MYLFTRRARLGPGHQRESLAWALEVTEKVNQISELPVQLFTTVFSPAVGTLSWGCFAPDLAALEATNDKLQSDDSFIALVDRGASYTTGVLDDTLIQLIHGEPDPARNVEYVTSVRALVNPGSFEKSVELGIRIAQTASQATGAETSFGTGMTGDYGTVFWLTGFADVTSMEAANAALNADPGFVNLVDKEAPGVYQAGVSATVQTIFRRIA